MHGDRLTEFVTVLFFALVFGACAWFALNYLEGRTQRIAILVLGAAAILTWQYLRRRFGRR